MLQYNKTQLQVKMLYRLKDEVIFVGGAFSLDMLQIHNQKLLQSQKMKKKIKLHRHLILKHIQNRIYYQGKSLLMQYTCLLDNIY